MLTKPLGACEIPHCSGPAVGVFGMFFVCPDHYLDCIELYVDRRREMLRDGNMPLFAVQMVDNRIRQGVAEFLVLDSRRKLDARGSHATD